MPIVVERATIAPASATRVSPASSLTWSIGNEGSYLMTCCIRAAPRSYSEDAGYARGLEMAIWSRTRVSTTPAPIAKPRASSTRPAR